MAFDPLAFIDPDKAFSLEGLLSRDMFEAFAASDEGRYDPMALEEDAYSGHASRLHFLAELITNMTGDIVTWVNQWGQVEVFIASAIVSIFGVAGAEWQTLYRLTVDDGPELSKFESLCTLKLIRKGLTDRISGVTMTEIERVDEDGMTLYTFAIKRT